MCMGGQVPGCKQPADVPLARLAELQPRPPFVSLLRNPHVWIGGKVDAVDRREDSCIRRRSATLHKTGLSSVGARPLVHGPKVADFEFRPRFRCFWAADKGCTNVLEAVGSSALRH